VSSLFLVVHTEELLLEDEYPTFGSGLYVSWAAQLPPQALESIIFNCIRCKEEDIEEQKSGKQHYSFVNEWADATCSAIH
jgi:hypothetical protein